MTTWSETQTESNPSSSARAPSIPIVSPVVHGRRFCTWTPNFIPCSVQREMLERSAHQKPAMDHGPEAEYCINYRRLQMDRPPPPSTTGFETRCKPPFVDPHQGQLPETAGLTLRP